MISEAKQSAIMVTVISTFRTLVPIDTGNLRYNAVKYRYMGNGKWQIEVDEAIAPYMPYTNEPWTSPRWGGKKNPNEHWFDDACDLIAMMLSQELHGELKRG